MSESRGDFKWKLIDSGDEAEWTQFTLRVPASTAFKPPMYSASIAAAALLASLATVLAVSSLEGVWGV